MHYSYTICDSPLGTLTLVADPTHLRELHVQGDRYFKDIPTAWKRNDKHPIIREVKTQLSEYFAGARTTFTVPIKMAGTDFQQKVWQQLQQIKPGATITYADIASAIGAPKAVRAVGTAVGKNPVCIVVPCHRVVASSGGLSGYVAGIERKQQLLELEQSLT